MQLTKNFTLEEFVPKEIFLVYGENSKWFVDLRLPAVMQKIRDMVNKPITINNWHLGGPFNYRGYRPSSVQIGALESQHRFGRAADFNIKGLTSEECRQFIRDNFQLLKPMGLSSIEKDSPSWCHVDLRWTNSLTLNEFKFFG